MTTSETIKRFCYALMSLFFVTLILPAPRVFAESPAEHALATTLDRIEADLSARIGVLIREYDTDWQWGHREDELFLMASTFKPILCAAILNRVDQGTLSLDDPVAVEPKDILAYAPITKRHIGKSLPIGDLCFATLDKSDNTAANLLIETLGGTQEVTNFVRSMGDSVTRLDRTEPALNLFSPGDPRDTTSPTAMLSTWETMLFGDTLKPKSRAQLRTWMSHGGATSKFLRARLPGDWQIADKSGGGRDHTRNLVAMISDPDRSRYFVAIYLSDSPSDWSSRNAAVSEISFNIMEILKTR